MAKYLDSTGLTLVWSKCKETFSLAGHTHDNRYVKFYNDHTTNPNIDSLSNEFYILGTDLNYGEGTLPAGSDNAVGIISMRTHWDYHSQLALETTTNRLYMRSSPAGAGFGSWYKVAYVSDLYWDNISGKPSTYTPSSHNHDSHHTVIANRDSSITFTSLAALSTSSVGMINPAADNPTGQAKWCHTWSQTWTQGSTANWVSQIALGTEAGNGMWYRCTSGNISGLGWKRVLDSSNYTSYTVQKDGTGSTGTWGINVTGSAGSVAWGNVTGKPSTFTPSSHSHSYLPLSGGILTGDVVFSTDSSLSWIRNTDSAKIYFKNTANDDPDSYMCFETSDDFNEYFKWTHKDYNGGNTEYMSLKSDGLRVGGNIVLHAGNYTSYCATAGHTHSNYLERLAWWNEQDSHSVDSLTTGTTFAYTTHSAPANGTIVAFSGTSGSYQLQLQGEYYGESLWFRNKNGDRGTWNTWRYVIHSGNIGSQSVSYASSAGSVDWSNVANKPSTYTPSSHDHDGRYVQTYPGTDIDPSTTYGYWHAMTTQSGLPGDWWHVLHMDWSGAANWRSELALPTQHRNGVYYRSDNWSWSSWIKLLDANNYTDYTVTKTGAGANGTWGISISGTATYASSAGNADTVDSKHASEFVWYYNNHDTNPDIDSLNGTPYLLVTDSGYGAGTKPSGTHNGFGVINLHTHGGNYYTQLGLDTNQNCLWIRSANDSSSFGSWEKILSTGNHISLTNSEIDTIMV